MNPVFVVGVDIYSLILITFMVIVFLLSIPAIFEEMVFRIRPRTTKLFFLEKGRLLNTKLYFNPISSTIKIKTGGIERAWEVTESRKVSEPTKEGEQPKLMVHEQFYWLNGKRRVLFLPYEAACAVSLYEPATPLSPEVHANCTSLARQEGMLIHKMEENQIKKIVSLVTIAMIASVVVLALELFKMSKG